MEINELQKKLKDILNTNLDIPSDEKEFLLENIGLFNETELQKLIDNNT